MPLLPARRRTALLSAVLASTLAVGAAHASPPVPVVPLATVAVAGCPANSVPVPADYLGLSIEWSMVQHWFGTDAAGVVQPTVALLESLAREPGKAGVLRIGGNSQDGYRWAPDAPTTRNHLFEGTISRGMIDALLEASRRSGWKVVLGVNLRANRPADAVGLARYALSHDPTHQLLAVELGNEPTLYMGSDSTPYMARIYTYVQALDADPVTRGVPIVGPSLANRADLGLLTAMRNAYPARLPFASWHHYANRPTLTGLLSDAVSKEWTDRIAAVQQAAGSTPTRMDEGNSVGKGGLGRVSDVMGSSAWLVDAMLTGAQAGISGFHAHAWDGYYYPGEHRESYYTPFVVRGGLVYPRPELYALALLRDLPGKRFCQAVTAAQAGQDVKSWTLVDPVSSRLLVFAVNKSVDAAGDVAVTVPLQYGGSASVSRISDPGGCGGRKTSIDGARLPTDGRYGWTPATVQPAAPSTYSIPLEPCETALLSVDLSATPQR